MYLVYLVIFISEFLIVKLSLFESYWEFVYLNCSIILAVVSLEVIKIRSNDRIILLNPFFLTLVFTFVFSLGGGLMFLLRENGVPLIFNGQHAQSVLLTTPKWFIKSTSLSVIALIATIFGYRSEVGKFLFSFYYKGLNFKALLQKRVSLLKFIVILLIVYLAKFYQFYEGTYGYQQLGSDEYINSRLGVVSKLSLVCFLIAGIAYRRDKIVSFKWVYRMLFSLEFIFSLSDGSRSAIIFFFSAYIFIEFLSLGKIKRITFFFFSVIFLYAFTIGNEYKKFISTNNKNDFNNPISTLRSFYEQRNQIAGELQSLNDAAIEASGNENILIQLTLSRFTYYSETALAVWHKDNLGLTVDDPPFTQYVIMAPLFAIFPPFYFFNLESPQWGGWFYKKVEQKITGTSSSAMSPLGFLYFLGGAFAVVFGFFIFGVIVKFTSMLKLDQGNNYFLFVPLLSLTYNFDSNVSDLFILFLRYILVLPIIYFFCFSKSH